jgi:hypothetical protein
MKDLNEIYTRIFCHVQFSYEAIRRILMIIIKVENTVVWDVTWSIYLLRHFGGTSVNIYQTIRHRIPDDTNLHSHRLHNFT